VSVKSPEVGVSNPTEIYSLSIIGASLTGVTVTKIVSLTQSAGNGVPQD